MVIDRIFLSQFVALAFFGDHMQKLRAPQLLDIVQRINEDVNVVPINRPGVVKAEFLEHCRWCDHALGMLFDTLGDFLEGRRGGKNFLCCFFGVGVKPPGHQLGKIIVKGTNAFRNRHVVVVQNHDQVLAADVVHGLECHAGSNRTVADDGDCVALHASHPCRDRHAQRGRNGGG